MQAQESRQLSRFDKIVLGSSGWLEDRLKHSSKTVLLLPAILIVLLLSIFPLLASLYISFTRVTFVKHAIDIQFIGLENYASLLSGIHKREFLGRIDTLSPLGWFILAAFGALMFFIFVRVYLKSPGKTFLGTITRLLGMAFGLTIAWLVLSTLTGEGLPGTVVVTLIFVFGGVFFQYILGLGLALLVTQELRGKRFFRMIFLLPMMITPVGIGFLFRMLTDTLIGPIAPVWSALGLVNFSWASTGFGARIAVMIGDIWQWTPFMFIFLLAALEGISQDQLEAARVDGVKRWQLFRYIILPQIIPVSTTLIMIRTIEAFKIIDMPNILTGGGPGTATESMTLQAFNLWRAIDLGKSAAVAYLLLVIVTFVVVFYLNSFRERIMTENHK